jgi:hypothetical protein
MSLHENGIPESPSFDSKKVDAAEILRPKSLMFIIMNKDTETALCRNFSLS